MPLLVVLLCTCQTWAADLVIDGTTITGTTTLPSSGVVNTLELGGTSCVIAPGAQVTAQARTTVSLKVGTWIQAGAAFHARLTTEALTAPVIVEQAHLVPSASLVAIDRAYPIAALGSFTIHGEDRSSTLTYAWSLVSGPAQPLFGETGTAAAKSTTVTCQVAGVYTLRCTLTSPMGTTAATELVMTACAPPTITAGPAATPSTVTSGSTALTVSATDPQALALSYQWSGGASVSFDDATSAATIARFSAAGSYALNVVVTNAAGATASGAVTVTVTPIPVITSAVAASGVVGQGFSYAILATYEPTSFAAAGLPAGLTCDAATGLISGTPVAPGVSLVTITAMNAAGSSIPAVVHLTIAADASGGDPPATPTVTLAIVGGLSGLQHAVIDGVDTALTRHDAIIVSITPTIADGSELAGTRLVASAGTVVAADATTWTLSGLPEGRIDLSATATVRKNGRETTGTALTSLALLVDRTVPSVQLCEPGSADGSAPLGVGLVADGAQPLLLNQASDALTLRAASGWRCWSVADLAIPVRISEANGLSTAELPTVTVGAASLTVTPASLDSTTTLLALTGFSALPESLQPDEGLVLTAGAGMQPLHLRVEDRCGNTFDADLCSVWKKTTAGGARFGYVPRMPSGFATTIGVIADNGPTDQAPGQLLATAADIVAVECAGTALHRLSASPTSWSGLAGATPVLWRLSPAIAADALDHLAATVTLRDLAGNRQVVVARATQTWFDAVRPTASRQILVDPVTAPSKYAIRILDLEMDFPQFLPGERYAVLKKYFYDAEAEFPQPLVETRWQIRPVGWTLRENPLAGSRIGIEYVGSDEASTIRYTTFAGSSGTLAGGLDAGLPQYAVGSGHDGSSIVSVNPEQEYDWGMLGVGYLEWYETTPWRVTTAPLSDPVYGLAGARPASGTADVAHLTGNQPVMSSGMLTWTSDDEGMLASYMTGGPWLQSVQWMRVRDRQSWTVDGDLEGMRDHWNTIEGALRCVTLPSSWATPAAVGYPVPATEGRLTGSDGSTRALTVLTGQQALGLDLRHADAAGFGRVQWLGTGTDGEPRRQQLGYRAIDMVGIPKDVIVEGADMRCAIDGGFVAGLDASATVALPSGSAVTFGDSAARAAAETALRGLDASAFAAWCTGQSAQLTSLVRGTETVTAWASRVLLPARGLVATATAAVGAPASIVQTLRGADAAAPDQALFRSAVNLDALTAASTAAQAAETSWQAKLNALVTQQIAGMAWEESAVTAAATAAGQAATTRANCLVQGEAAWAAYRQSVATALQPYRNELAACEADMQDSENLALAYAVTVKPWELIQFQPIVEGVAIGYAEIPMDWVYVWFMASLRRSEILNDPAYTTLKQAEQQAAMEPLAPFDHSTDPALCDYFADRTWRTGDLSLPGLLRVTALSLTADALSAPLKQTLVCEMSPASSVVGVYDVLVRCGLVHAYPDELSQQYAGANGAHRMKEALAVVKLAVKDVEVGQMESKRIQDFITFEAPHLQEDEIENLMKGWTIEWPTGGNAYLLENDPAAFKKLTAIKPLMITESKGVQDVYVLGGNVIHDELDAEPQPYTGQFYIRTDNLTATMGISGVLGNITVTPAVAQIQTVYDAQKTFIAAPKGLPSLLGRPGIVSFRDAQWDFDLKPGNPGTDGTGRNTKFIVRFDGSVQSDLNMPCVRITKWDDGKSFHVTGDYPGTGILQVRPLFGEEEGDVICEIPIPVEIPVISEPSMLQLDTAKARAETRRNSNDENLIEDPTPLAADENDNPLLEMPKSHDTAYPFGQVVAPTASVQRLDGIYEHAMFVAGQILPITADGWTEPFDSEKNSDAAFTFPSSSNDYELSLALLCSLLTDGSSTSPAPVQSKLALSPVADIWRRYQRRIKQQTDKDLEPRGAQDVLAQEKRAIELRGKTLVQLASAARLKRFFSLSVDGEDKPTVQGLANWSYPSGPLGQHLPMMGESGGNIIYISDVDDLKSALGNWMGSVGLPKLFQNSPAAIDWKYGHPLTEDLITHMVGERMDFTKTAMAIVGADWSAHLTPIWYDEVVPNELMNAKVHYFMDADGWVKLRMIGASGQNLNWTLCPSQEGYPQGYYTYQGTTYRLLRVRADSPIGLGVGLAQDEIYRLLMAYNHRAYADYWTSFGNNSPTGLFAFVIGDTLFGITDIFQAYTGTDLVTGENLSNGQRAYSAAMVLLMVVPADTLVLKGVAKLLRSGKSALSATSKAIYENVSKSAAGSEAARGAKAMADAAEDQIATQGAKQTPTGTPSAGDGLGSAARRPGGFVAMGWQGVRQVFRGTYSISDLYNLHAGCAALTNHVVVAKGATSPLVGMFRSLAVAGKQVLASPLSLKYLPRNARELIDNFASQQQFIDEMIEVYGREEGMKKLEYLRKIACFTGDTSVLIADGSRKPISQIAVGDWVATRSQFDASAPMTAGRVTEVFRHDTTELRVIRAVRQTGNELLSVVIRTTDEHPFWRISSGWVVAAALNSGDKVASTDGCLTIMTVDREYTRQLSVYNLQIDGGSTYFVGGNEFGGDVWVHNVCRQQHIMLKYLRAHPDLLGGRPVAAVANDALVKLSKGESMGIPGIVIPGDSKKLGASLGGKPFTDAAAHHLLSSEVVKRPGPVGDFFQRVGFDCNRRGNGMWLPMKNGVLGATPLTIHDGNHPGYRNALEEVIKEVISASAAPGKGDVWAIRKIRKLQLLIRKELRNGTPLDMDNDPGGFKVQSIWETKLSGILP